MKNPRYFVALLLVLTLASARAATPLTEEALHAELRQLKTTYENALFSGDLTPLAPLFDAESSGVTVDNQSFRSFAELKAIYDRFHADFPGVVYRLKLDSAPALLVGPLAIAHGTAAESVTTAAGEFNYTSTWTIVMKRTDAGWKLVRSQVTMDPFRNSIVTFFQSRARLFYGLGGAAVGFALGLVFFAFLRRKKTATTG
jgi:hypothetical protein